MNKGQSVVAALLACILALLAVDVLVMGSETAQAPRDEATASVAAEGDGGCLADLDGDGNVGFGDLSTLLANWRPCP